MQALLTRLRDLEAEALRLSVVDLPAERAATRKLYEKRLEQLENSHSRSWFGDHSSTYFQNFQSPPPGRTFDVEWGFIPGFSGSRNQGWQIYSRDEIRHFVFEEIGEDIFYELNALAEQLTKDFSVVRNQALDVMEILSAQAGSKATIRYTGIIENELKPYEIVDSINARVKSVPRMTRNSEELAKGQSVPAQVQYLAPIQSLDANKRRLRDLAGVLRNAIEAINLYAPKQATIMQSKKIFIGHGPSEQWRVLKDFIKDRLHLKFEEFNRISAAGMSTKERLSDMLDECGFAFLVLVGEDLHGDGSLHARENVIHEAGLFQGRLGWRKAIIILEESCQEFSNIVGLGQIRFSKGNIESCFEDIRRVLERESVLSK